MTARKTKPRKAAPRKRSKPTLSQRVADLEETVDLLVAARLDGFYNRLNEQAGRIDSLEARGHFRDASHDEPVSNAGEAVGQHFRIVGEAPRAPRWRRFLNFMSTP